MQQNFGQTIQTQGLFQQPIQTGGIFGKPPSQTSSAFGTQFNNPQQPTGAFGQTSAFGQATSPGISGGLFGQAQPQPQSLSVFGQSAQPTTGGLFQNQSPTQPSAFAQQPQGAGMWGGAQQSSGFGLPQNQTPQNTTSSFFGGASNFNANSQPQQQFGAFGQQPQQQTQLFQQPQNTTLFGQPQQIQQKFGQGTGGQFGGMQATGQKMIYSDQQQFKQILTSIGRPFQIQKISVQDNNSAPQSLSFTNIRIDQDFEKISTQMLHLYDIKQSKNLPNNNYEFLAMQEFNINQQKYPLLMKLQAAMNSDKTQPGSLQAQISAPGFNQLSGQSTLQFGQQQQFGGGAGIYKSNSQQQTQSQLFNQQTPAPGGLFGQQQQNAFAPQTQTQPFGATSPQAPGNTIFGQANSPNIFGQQQPQAQGAQGIFGQTTQQTQPFGGGGLLGQAVQPQQQTGSLFGQQQPTQAQGIGGSLFGQQAQPPKPVGNLFVAQGAGLFENKTQTQTPLNLGLNNTQPQSSLFGAQQPTQAAGLFGGQAQTGTLFSQQPKPLSQPGSSLFGGQPQQSNTGIFNGGSSLFGNTQQAPLFTQPQQQQTQQSWGQPQQQQTQQIQVPQNFVDLYSSKDPLGLQNSFLNKEHPLENIQKEIDEIKKQLESKYAPPSQDSNILYGRKNVNLYISFTEPQEQYYEEESQRQRAKQDAKQRKLIEAQQAASKHLKTITQPMSLYRSFEQLQTKPDLSQRVEQQIYQYNRETIKMTSTYVYNAEQKYSHIFEIHKSRDTDDVIRKVVAWLRTEFNFDGPSQDVLIKYKETCIESGKTLKDFGIQNDASLMVSLKSQELEKQRQLELIPKPPKQGYQCSPDITKLQQMTIKELETVKEFTVSNEFGSVKWFGETDVTGIDLSDIITISQGNCEVYDDQRHAESKPKVGFKLNKPACIILQNIKPKPNQSGTDKENNLRRSLESGGAEHLFYDVKKFEWQFKVEHFTKWGENAEDEEMAETDPQPPAHQAQQQFESELLPCSPIANQTINQVMQVDSSSESNFMFKNQMQQKRFHQMPVIEKPQMIQKFEYIKVPEQSFQQESESQKIMEKIKKREELFKKKQNYDKISETETMVELQKLGFKNFQNTSIGKRFPKPCFHPKGNSILFKQNNEIHVRKLPQIEEFRISDVIQMHMTNEQVNLSLEFNSLNLGQVDQEMESDQSSFEDEFFRKLFDKELPQTVIFQNQDKIHQFLQDLARHYAKTKLESNKLRHEFYVVCMINALFGNPCQQLNQLHPKINGPDSQFQLKPAKIDEHCLSVQKQRRNAVIEVLRLLCQQEFPVKKPALNATDDQVYSAVLQMLEVGDIKQAIRSLNECKKTKIALIVSQSVSNQFAMNYVSKHVDLKCKKIIDFISGQAKPSNVWQKNLLYQLMYKQCHSVPLSQIVKDQRDQNKNQESLLWKLMTVYAKIEDSDNEIHQMKGNLFQAHDPRDFRIRWITQIVLRSVLLHQASQEQRIDEWQSCIPDNVLTNFSAKFIYQLLSQKNWKEAFQVALLIPCVNIRKRILFEILSRCEDIKDFQISDQFRNSLQAIKLQSESQPGLAVKKWIDCGNSIWAEDLFQRMVLPSYLKKQVNLNNLKQLYLEPKLDNLLVQNGYFDIQIKNIKDKYPREPWFTTPCALYLRVRDLQRDFNSHQNIYQELVQIQESIPKASKQLQAWLKAEVMEMKIALMCRNKTNFIVAFDSEGLAEAQAKRGSELILTKSLIQQ